jgi:cellulose synthase/poly-beta-1,6-N-acetylglucosamine synthase-like glycosyltransferase
MLTFTALYVQVFFLVTFLENRKKIVYRSGAMGELPEYPTVTVIVPCWNEEKTIHKTIESLLALDYPKDKLEIFLIDDGSTDNTWTVMQAFASHPQIQAFHKENGGKHTAMNMGIELSKADLITCLDADSFVDTHALKRIITYFKKDPEVMAVAPSIIVHNPQNIIQTIQKIEYDMAVYIKKMLGLNGGIHVAPGPFSTYKREIFKTIGLFRKAHNTEDMEIAYRMQKFHMKIEQCNDAYVYTVSPNTIPKLYKQRLRWIHGFIRNTVDYRKILFNPKYGTFSLFTVPSGIISISAAVFLFGSAATSFVKNMYEKSVEIRTVGFHWSLPSVQFDWFFINTHTTAFLLLFLYSFVLLAILIGTRMSTGKAKFPFHIVSYMIIYSIIAPFWLIHAMYKAVSGKAPSWR